jgi:hypothetical protein
MRNNAMLQATYLGVTIVLVSVLFMPGLLFSAGKQIVIQNGASRTQERSVVLTLSRPSTDMNQMKISNDISFSDAEWEPYATTKSWKVSLGSGVKSVYVIFKNKSGDTSPIYNDTIELSIPKQISASVVINANDDNTKKRSVALSISYSKGVEEMYISNSNTFDVFDTKQPTSQVQWLLSEGSGSKTVYVQFRDANGTLTTVSDTIEYKEPPGTLPGGTILKAPGGELYYLGFDGALHAFLHPSIFHSWYDEWSDVTIRQVTPIALRNYAVGRPVCMRGGTWLVQFAGLPQVYAVENGCRLFPLRSEVESIMFFGKDWKKRVVVLDNVESTFYTIYSRGVGDSANNVVDGDSDGLDKDTEQVYGTDDTLSDTDRDGLTDIEEVLAWSTDPTKKSTNGNGVSDVRYVIDTFLSGDQLVDVPEVYQYPGGLIFRDAGDGKYYMSYVDHQIYFLGNSLSSNVFTSNNFSPRFVGVSSPFVPYTNRSGWYVLASAPELLGPSIVNQHNNLYAL